MAKTRKPLPKEPKIIRLVNSLEELNEVQQNPEFNGDIVVRFNNRDINKVQGLKYGLKEILNHPERIYELSPFELSCEETKGIPHLGVPQQVYVKYKRVA